MKGVFGMVFVSGCITQKGNENQQEEVKILLNNVFTDKSVYRSAETVNLTLSIYSNSDLKNVVITANGINGRLSMEKIFKFNRRYKHNILHKQIAKMQHLWGNKGRQLRFKLQNNIQKYNSK